MSARLNKFKVKSLKLKVILPFLLFTFCFLLISPAHAAPLGSNNFNYLINGQTTLEGSVSHATLCMLIGMSPFNACAGYQASRDSFGKPNVEGSSNSGSDSNQSPTQGQASYAKIVVLDRLPSGGGLGMTGNMIATLYNNPPVDSGYYLANLGKDFGLIRPAYAQSVTGSGERIIAPIYRLWLVTRNLAYAAFIIIIIAIGFMIMLRQRINPQTVVSIQQAIPSIIIGLALVTTSYFIASLLIDLTFLGTNLVGQIFILTGGNRFGGETEINKLIQNGNIFELFHTVGLNGQALGQVFGGVFNQVMTTFGFGSFLVPAILAAIGGFLSFNIPLIIGGAVGAATPIIIPTLVIIVLLFALFIQIIRLAFALISAYVELLILTIAGPFFILWGSIPGRGGTITYWLRGLIANSLIFPAVLAAFLFAGLILDSGGSSASLFTVYAQSNNSSPSSLPLFGGLSQDFIKVLIAYGILLGSPKIPDMVKEALKWKGPAGISEEALVGANAGILGFNSTRAVGGGLSARAYEQGRYNRPLTWLRDTGGVPGFIRRRIPPTLPTGARNIPPRVR